MMILQKTPRASRAREEAVRLRVRTPNTAPLRSRLALTLVSRLCDEQVVSRRLAHASSDFNVLLKNSIVRDHANAAASLS